MAPNLTVNVSTATSNEDSIGFDPVLAWYKSSAPSYNDQNPKMPVLIPLVDGGGQRLLLGPSEMSGSAVADAQAVFQSPSWVVNATLTGTGSTEWDAMSKKYFHEIIGIDVDGLVVSDPLTLPSQATWTSFGGRVQISGSFGKRSAEELAASLDSGPYAASLRVRP
jgi:preprotein translocase subunit SecD